MQKPDRGRPRRGLIHSRESAVLFAVILFWVVVFGAMMLTGG